MAGDEELRERARRLWALGDYDEIADRLYPAAEALVEVAGVQRGTRVLDIGAGTGNVAIAAAQRGATVVATDIAPSMVERGRARTAGSEIDWLEADAEELPFDDGAFDAATSAFGLVYAPHPERVSRELLRVLRPGGVAAFTAWGRFGIQPALLDAVAGVAGVPPGDQSPEDWGEESVVRERLSQAAEVHTERRTLRWVFDSAQAWVAFMTENAPPVVALMQALPPERQDLLRERLVEVVLAHGHEQDGGFVVEPEYLLVTARR